MYTVFIKLCHHALVSKSEYEILIFYMSIAVIFTLIAQRLAY